MTDAPDDIEAIMVRARMFGAQTAIFCELVRLLIERGILNQGDVIARYEALSAELMRQGSKEGTQLADIVRDLAAGEPERKRSYLNQRRQDRRRLGFVFGA